jgi:hypothetical protein
LNFLGSVEILNQTSVKGDNAETVFQISQTGMSAVADREGILAFKRRLIPPETLVKTDVFFTEPIC